MFIIELKKSNASGEKFVSGIISKEENKYLAVRKFYEMFNNTSKDFRASHKMTNYLEENIYGNDIILGINFGNIRWGMRYEITMRKEVA